VTSSQLYVGAGEAGLISNLHGQLQRSAVECFVSFIITTNFITKIVTCQGLYYTIANQRWKTTARTCNYPTIPMNNKHILDQQRNYIFNERKSTIKREKEKT
jgi:hypothetical protein